MVKRYKALLIVPTLILIFSVAVLANSYMATGEWFLRSVDFKGGSQIQFEPAQPIDIESLEEGLSQEFTVHVSESKGILGYQVIIETDADTDDIKAELGRMGIDTAGFSTNTIGPKVGEGFWYQAQMAIVLAFVFMGIIVFIIFRKSIPSFAVMLCAVSDILVTLAIMRLIGLELSLASLAAILMLIGYSIDTDIMLTTRLLKSSGNVGERVRSALGTGLTMSLTTIGALTALIIFNFPVISHIATVLFIGLVVDITFTWLQNSVLLRWHCERGGI